MNKPKIFLITTICFLISVNIANAEESLTITTYYPSPYGSYNQLQTNSFGVGDNDGDGSLDSGDVPTTAGDAWIKGKVGIGTSNPQNLLHIKETTLRAGITLESTTGAADKWEITSLDNSGKAGLVFTDASTNKNALYLKEDGNVGIGTNNPLSKLEVNGTITSGSGGINRAWVTLLNSGGCAVCPTGWTAHGCLQYGSFWYSTCYRDF